MGLRLLTISLIWKKILCSSGIMALQSGCNLLKELISKGKEQSWQGGEQG